jgi:hypothetical protein
MISQETQEAIARYMRNCVLGLRIRPTPEQIQRWCKMDQNVDVTLEEIAELKIPTNTEIRKMFQLEFKKLYDDEPPPPPDVYDP